MQRSCRSDRSRFHPAAVITTAAIALTLTAALTATLVASLPAQAADDPADLTEQQVGTRFMLRAADLPPPYSTRSTGNPSRRLARPDGATLRVPDGFRANLFATDLTHPRWLQVAPNGDVFLAESRAGRITLLRDSDGDGRADRRFTFADGLDRPHGMALRDGWLYVGETTQVRRLGYRDGATAATTAPMDVTAPGSLGYGGGHWTRNIAFDPRGDGFAVAVGSAGNIRAEAPPRATIQHFTIDGRGQSTFASGLRNPVGIAYHPTTGDLYAVVNERDGLGDGLVPDYLTRVTPGAFFGWPYGYIGNHPDPTMDGQRPDLVARTQVPGVLFQAHSAPLGLVFYDGDQFPADWRGDAFVALHGSWNSSQPTGYKIVRVPFREGRPDGSYVNFATGFWTEGIDRAGVIGRPVGLAVWTDGSLLVADDAGRAVWRISYTGPN